jgi:hypothetical protein
MIEYNIPRRTLSETSIGHTISDEGKRKISIANKGHKVSRKVRDIISKKNKGKHFSPETEFKKGMIGLRGKNSPVWKGGVSTTNELIRKSKAMVDWKSKVYERDEYTCQICGIVGGRLNAHHIKELSKIIDDYNIKNLDDGDDCEELWDIDNGITLCEDCHKKIHSGDLILKRYC